MWRLCSTPVIDNASLSPAGSVSLASTLIVMGGPSSSVLAESGFAGGLMFRGPSLLHFQFPFHHHRQLY